MLHEVLDCLQPGPGSVLIDGTFGAGGYSRALLEAGAFVLAIDRDPDAIANGRELASACSGKLKLVQGRFSQLDQIANENGINAADGVVLDIGVSSMQLDEAGRGFSFSKDGPLDMRMAQSGVSAADVVNHAAQKDLTRIIGILGEEKQASRISRAIAAISGLTGLSAPPLRSGDSATSCCGALTSSCCISGCCCCCANCCCICCCWNICCCNICC